MYSIVDMQYIYHSGHASFMQKQGRAVQCLSMIQRPVLHLQHSADIGLLHALVLLVGGVVVLELHIGVVGRDHQRSVPRFALARPNGTTSNQTLAW